MAVQDVRACDQRGRHTTTERRLLALPSGALVVDNPGLREVGLWVDEEAAAQEEDDYDDLEALALHCRYRSCQHGNDGGCALRAAVTAGELDEDRLRNYLKLLSEAERLVDRKSVRARREARIQGKKFAKLRKRLNQGDKQKFQRD